MDNHWNERRHIYSRNENVAPDVDEIVEIEFDVSIPIFYK